MTDLKNLSAELNDLLDSKREYTSFLNQIRCDKLIYQEKLRDVRNRERAIKHTLDAINERIKELES